MAIQIADRVRGAYAAGFRNGATIEALSIIVAISLAECGMGSSTGCETGCNYDCCPPAQSCGMLQVYQPWHPGTAGCASDPNCIWTLGWSISNQGTGFGAWSTYKNGAFRNHLQAARDVINSMPPPIGPQPSPTPQPVPAPTPQPDPSPPPDPAPVSPAGSSSVGWLLLVAGAGGLAWYEAKRRGIDVSLEGDREFGAGKVAVSRA